MLISLINMQNYAQNSNSIQYVAPKLFLDKNELARR